MSEEPLRPLLVVWPDRFELHERFAKRLSGVIPVVLDRRGASRRRAETLAGADRRHAERRRLVTREARERFRALGYQLVYTFPAAPSPGGILFALVFCGECERLLEFEMPRFVENPASVGVMVGHALSRGAIAHPVDLEALTASGRLLLACEVTSREVTM